MRKYMCVTALALVSLDCLMGGLGAWHQGAPPAGWEWLWFIAAAVWASEAVLILTRHDITER